MDCTASTDHYNGCENVPLNSLINKNVARKKCLIYFFLRSLNIDITYKRELAAVDKSVFRVPEGVRGRLLLSPRTLSRKGGMVERWKGGKAESSHSP